MYTEDNFKKKSTRQKSNFLRYFEGYTEVPSLTPQGAVQVKMVYTAPYWVHDMTDREWKRRKAGFGGLTTLITALYLCGAFMPLGGNAARYMMLPGGITAAILLFLITYTVAYLSRPRKMTVYDYRHTHGALRCWPFLTALGLLATGIMSVVCLIADGEGKTLRLLLCAGCYFVGAFAAFIMYRMENKTEYYEEENENGYTSF